MRQTLGYWYTSQSNKLKADLNIHVRKQTDTQASAEIKILASHFNGRTSFKVIRSLFGMRGQN